MAAILFASFCIAALIAGIAMFQRLGGRGGSVWRTLDANAYGIYYVHPLILYPLTFLLLDLDAPPTVKAVLATVLTLVASIAVSELLLRRLPGLRRIF